MFIEIIQQFDFKIIAGRVKNNISLMISAVLGMMRTATIPAVNCDITVFHDMFPFKGIIAIITIYTTIGIMSNIKYTKHINT